VRGSSIPRKGLAYADATVMTADRGERHAAGASMDESSPTRLQQTGRTMKHPAGPALQLSWGLTAPWPGDCDLSRLHCPLSTLMREFGCRTEVLSVSDGHSRGSGRATAPLGELG